MTQAAYDGWKADMLTGKVTLMAALNGTDVTALAARARADRVTAGQVEPDGTRLRDGNLAGRGDWIVTRRNDRRLTTRGGRDSVKNITLCATTRRVPAPAAAASRLSVPWVRSSLVTANSRSSRRKLRSSASAVISCTITSGAAGPHRRDHALPVQPVDDHRFRARRAQLRRLP